MSQATKIIDFVLAAGELGGGSVLLAIVLFGIAIWEHYKKENVAAVWLLIVATAFFCFGGFSAWDTERQARKLDEGKLSKLEQPNLQARIEEINFAVGNGQTSILYVVNVRNLGAPSIIDAYNLRMNLPEYSQCVFNRMQLPPEGLKLIDKDSSKIRRFSPDSALYEKASVQPIVTGSKVVGTVWFLTKCIDEVELAKNEKYLQLSFTDVIGQRTVASDITDKTGPSYYYPGLRK